MLDLDQVLLLVYYCINLYVGSLFSILFISVVASLLIHWVDFLIISCRKHCCVKAVTLKILLMQYIYCLKVR